MCCRFHLHRADLEQLAERVGVVVRAKTASRYNIAPGTKITAVRNRPRPGGRELCELRWGLVPSWSKTGAAAAPLVNARAEGLVEKPSFREAFRVRRCLIPASGFYEWQIVGRARRPWHFQLSSSEPFFLAGLWEQGIASNGEPFETCAVITTAPNELMRPVHHRMPAVLPTEQAEQWLDPLSRVEALATECLRPFCTSRMSARPLDTRINSTAHDDEACLAAAPTGVAERQLAWDL